MLMEEEELELLKKHKIDFVVLARYMQILSADFVNHYPNKVINIHHSFLPALMVMQSSSVCMKQLDMRTLRDDSGLIPSVLGELGV